MQSKPTALITGASSGIGRAAAEKLAREGYQVILAARRKDRLQEICQRITIQGGKAHAVPTDLSRVEDIQNLVKQVESICGTVDVLINNAGFGRLLWLDEQSLEDDIGMQIQVNLTGAIQLTRALLPGMLEARRGQIIFVSSISAFVGVPTYSIYTATKAGLRGFMQSLRREVRDLGITITGVYPGAVDTEFDQHAGVHWETTRVTPGWLLLSSEQVAEQIYRAVKLRKSRVVVPAIMRLAIWGNAHFPGLVGWILAKYFSRENGKHTAWNFPD